ncbi:unnamed protein product [Ilex paraguariensis]|uniref:NPR1/NIM1-like C-terminal domain-containing protein n=1 Tax=Ilex paraguariensis TaxID=185542 RepID=A0ABC8RGP8_9AQUA
MSNYVNLCDLPAVFSAFLWAVELGKRFFPRCSAVLNKIMDADDISQLAYVGNDTPEERELKKQRHMELQEVLSKAFREDKEEFNKTINMSSPSSSTSVGVLKPNELYKSAMSNYVNLCDLPAVFSAFLWAVELGKRFFPRCSAVLNKIMDADDISQLAYVGNDTPEERELKKQRHMELQEVLSKAFREDKEEFNKTINMSSPSSSTSVGVLKPNGKHTNNK